MIHYHGTPFGGNHRERVTFLTARHALIPFGGHSETELIADICQSFCVDNGAFSAWKKGTKTDWEGYVEFCKKWRKHPGFDFCIIPDVIDGTETENNELMDWFVMSYGFKASCSPVWHMHETIDRLKMLCERFDRVCLGSSGEVSTPGTAEWWKMMNAAMLAICDNNGQPPCKLHGLRMLDPEIFTRLPLASADSTNCVRNSCSYERFGIYVPPSRGTRAAVIAERIESRNSAPVFTVKAREKHNGLFGDWEDE